MPIACASAIANVEVYARGAIVTRQVELPADGLPAAGCEVVEDYCFGTLYHVECAPMDAGPRPWCTTDGAIPRPCTTDSDCGSEGDTALVCNARGVCDCPTDAPTTASGCAAAPGDGTSTWPALAVALLAVLWRRRLGSNIPG